MALGDPQSVAKLFSQGGVGDNLYLDRGLQGISQGTTAGNIQQEAARPLHLDGVPVLFHAW